ncbi:MAG: response regulator [Acidobacteria bacterium]|nr:response regulator [Acidobacteriota bacterium]
MNIPISERFAETRRIEVLLAEDNPGDVRLTREALNGSRIRINLSVAADGEEALAFLRRQGKYAGAARPQLVLLDLNMPKKDGREVLAEMKKDPDLDCIPVVILTTSDAEEDIIRSYKLRANAYVTKPTYVDQFKIVVTSIEDFWMRVAKLPPHCGTLK